MVAIILMVVALGVAIGGAFASRHLKARSIALNQESEKLDQYSDERRDIKYTSELFARYSKGAIGVSALSILAMLTTLGASTIYRQDPGEASVLVNIGGNVTGEDYTPGFSVKKPWEDRVEFNLFSQQLIYAGTNGEAPAYTDGVVNGNSISAAVARGVMADFDVSITYNIQGDKVSEIYEKYKSQENFTRQVITQRTLSVLRAVPAKYTPTEFRGDKRGEAQEAMLSELKKELAPFGVDVQTVSLQNIRYAESVEESLKAVEVAQQKQAEAEANLRATEVNAQAKVVEAKAEAEANELLKKSLDNKILQQMWIEAIKGSKGTIVVPDGAAPLLNFNAPQGE